MPTKNLTTQSPTQDEEEFHVYSVSEVTRDVKAILEAAFETVWIEGEISNFRVAASQHAYFILKDNNAQIRCVLFRNQKSGLKFTPQDGDQVVMLGRVTVYEARGDYQVIVESMEPRGLGALQKAFEQLKEKLSKEGLFDEEKKKELPEYPWKIGIVTSPTGAAIRDMINVLNRRNSKVSVLLNPVKVQGQGAAEEIANAIQEMNQQKDLDLIIIGRGGGSIEDLWAFNEEIVARAIYQSRLPVVSAIGHEIDYTISDFVADLRAPTPSAAIELAVPLLEDIEEDLAALTIQSLENVLGMIDDYRDQLRYLMDRRFFREPHQILETSSQRLDELSQRLFRGLDQGLVIQKQKFKNMIHQLLQATPEKNLIHWKERQIDLNHRMVQKMQSQIKLAQKQFEGLAQNLNSLSPLSVLDRGYSITINKKTGKVIKTSQTIKKADSLEIRLSKGKLNCTVDETFE